MAASTRGAWPRPGLPAMAAGAWFSWLAWLGLMAAMLAAGPWHPHFLPATAVFGLFVVASLAVLVGGPWRLAFGPGRLRAATWLLLGVAPALFVSGHLLYALRLNSARILVLDLPTRLLIPFGEAAMDLEARFRYPERTEGEEVVMIAAPSPIAREQVVAMDEHVRALRARLGGRAIDEKIHWVRGPLLGSDGRAALGMCMGSGAGEVGTEGDPLAYLDRHEVAHCVLNGFVPFLVIDPPALLVEGWAEANAGRPREDVRRQVWNMRRNGDERPLRTLVGPAWYHAHAGAVYPQGAIFVDHVLDAYGPAKFLELYRTCRPGTFEADCRRVLGVGLDDLDAACRAEVDRAAPQAASPGDSLAALKLGPGVDERRWESFVGGLAAGIDRWDRAYERGRAVVAMTWSASSAAEGPAGGGVRWTWMSSGPRRAVVFEESGTKEGDRWSASPGPKRSSAWSAAPERSFRATREGAGQPWRLEDEQGGASRAAYLRMCAEVDGHRPPALTPRPGIFGVIERPEVASRFRATSLETSEGPDGRRVRLRIESDAPIADFELRSSECVLDADRGLAILSEVQAHEGGGESRAEFRYDDGDPPLLVSKRLIGSGRGQNERVVEWTVVERRLGPIADEAFAPEALLDGPVVVGEAVEVPWTDPPTFADWYPAPLAAGAAAVVAGLILGAAGGFRRP